MTWIMTARWRNWKFFYPTWKRARPRPSAVTWRWSPSSASIWKRMKLIWDKWPRLGACRWSDLLTLMKQVVVVVDVEDGDGGSLMRVHPHCEVDVMWLAQCCQRGQCLQRHHRVLTNRMSKGCHGNPWFPVSSCRAVTKCADSVVIFMFHS